MHCVLALCALPAGDLRAESTGEAIEAGVGSFTSTERMERMEQWFSLARERGLRSRWIAGGTSLLGGSAMLVSGLVLQGADTLGPRRSSGS